MKHVHRGLRKIPLPAKRTASADNAAELDRNLPKLIFESTRIKPCRHDERSKKNNYDQGQEYQAPSKRLIFGLMMDLSTQQRVVTEHLAGIEDQQRMFYERLIKIHESQKFFIEQLAKTQEHHQKLLIDRLSNMEEQQRNFYREQNVFNERLLDMQKNHPSVLDTVFPTNNLGIDLVTK